MHTFTVYRGIRSTLIAASISLVCLLVVNPSIGHAETVIGTGAPVETEQNHVAHEEHFGDPQTPTYGEVITAPAGNAYLDGFTFYLKVSPNLDFHAYVYEWDSELSRATGAALYTSGVEHTSSESSYEPVIVSTGGIAVVPGQKYVIFISISADGTEDAGTRLGGEWNTHPGSAYAEGLSAWLESGYEVADFTTTPWNTSAAGAYTFEARFSTSEPSVSSVTPSSVEPEEVVTIEGSDFENVTEVLFGSTPATGFAVVSNEELTATVPSGPSGQVDVRVVTGAGESPITPGDVVTYPGTTTTTTTTAPTTTTTTSKTTSTTTTTTVPTTTTTTTAPTTTTTTTTTKPTTTTTTTTSAPTTTTTTAPTTTTTTSSKPTTTTTTSSTGSTKSSTTTTTTTTTTTQTTTTATGALGTIEGTAVASEKATTTAATTTTTTTASKAVTSSPKCVVPELHGLTLLDARRALHAAHCEVGAVHHAYSRHKKDRVYEQSVRKGTVWPSAHRVSVWDSLGSQPVS